MFYNFNEINEKKVEGLRGGKGYCSLYKILDAPNSFNMLAKIIIHPNSSIGEHFHMDDEETIYILEGNPLVLDDKESKRCHPTDVNICKKGHSHSVINDTEEDVVILAMVTK